MISDELRFLEDDVVVAAKRLLGCLLIRETEIGRIVVRIVETEAYHQTDAASHSYKGSTPRTAVMFGPAGRLYVYFTYGMHYCMNIVTGKAGEGSAVLLRAAEPVEGIELMRHNRHGVADTMLTNGPAKLCQALDVSLPFNGHDVTCPPVLLRIEPATADADIVTATRIGISRDVDRPWRFYLKDNTFVSKR